MSFFGIEKKTLISISALHTTATQVATTSVQTATIFNLISTTQLVSSIGYPTITVSGGVITFEAGWKYFVELRLKCNSPNNTDGEYLEYYFTNTSLNTISSIGRLLMYRNLSTSGASTQEKCVMYLDNTLASSQALIRFLRVGGASNSTLNGSIAGYNSYAKSYILIKAWR